jgi:hypothetical protein
VGDVGLCTSDPDLRKDNRERMPPEWLLLCVGAELSAGLSDSLLL